MRGNVICAGFLITFRFVGRLVRFRGPVPGAAAVVVVSLESVAVDSFSRISNGVLGTTNLNAWITRIRGVCKYDGLESWGVFPPQWRHSTLTSFSTPP